jgi:cytoplasmic iron level regulating protein YaaA (DUF328/UPF0246 family)
MLTLLSPAKTLDFETPSPTSLCTKPDFLDLSQGLINGLSNLSVDGVGSLMGLSEKLAQLNYDRIQKWSKEHGQNTSKQAITAFKGDVYEGLKAWNFNKSDFEYAQKHLRILSGLYGILKPLDLIQPYRLEMGTLYANPAGRDLYAFWGDHLAKSISQDLAKNKSKTIVNLASLEYSKAARLNKIDAEVISPVFKDEKNGNFKIISFYAKRARGLMASFIITNQIEDPAKLTDFSSEGYTYSLEQSKPTEPVFLRAESKRSAA